MKKLNPMELSFLKQYVEGKLEEEPDEFAQEQFHNIFENLGDYHFNRNFGFDYKEVIEMIKSIPFIEKNIAVNVTIEINKENISTVSNTKFPDVVIADFQLKHDFKISRFYTEYDDELTVELGRISFKLYDTYKMVVSDIQNIAYELADSEISFSEHHIFSSVSLYKTKPTDRTYPENTAAVWGKILILDKIELNSPFGLEPPFNKATNAAITFKKLINALKYIDTYDFIFVDPNLDPYGMKVNNFIVQTVEEYMELLSGIGFNEAISTLNNKKYYYIQLK